MTVTEHEFKTYKKDLKSKKVKKVETHKLLFYYRDCF